MRMSATVRRALAVFLLAAAPALLGAEEPKKAETLPSPASAPAGSGAAALERLKALAGDWIEIEPKMGAKGAVAVMYRVTGAGSAVVSTLAPGTPHEMVSVWHRDGSDLVMTHYCAAQNQPRFRTKTVPANVVAMEFDGGTNLDPAKDVHIHAVKVELLGPDEIRETWIGWKGGKTEEPPLVLHLKRKLG
ncbi:MAG: hypothetical protein ACYDBY_01650 [Thermoanaerobaculia bacterium]